MSVADVDWPRGSYGFPKPKSGCPGDKNNWWWHEGWRFQDMEDDSKNISRRSRTSPGSHMSVTINIDRDVNRTFCMKQNPGTKDWPKGIVVVCSVCYTAVYLYLIFH